MMPDTNTLVVEAEGHLKLLPPSTLVDIYKVFEHIDMLCSAYSNSLKQLYPSYFLCHLWIQNDVITICHG